MKKLAAMLLSLVMCFSLLAIPAQAISTMDPDDPDVIVLDEDSTESGKDPTGLGKEGPDEPENPDPLKALPAPRDDFPGHA